MQSIPLFKLPKWKITQLVTISIFTSFSVFSQTPPNQQNALNPTGNVGVGTITPDSKLQVNGSMSVDSSLTVRDTAVFEKQARMKDKVIVEGDAVIKGKLTARDNLKVVGTTKIEGPIKLINLNNAQPDDTTFLVIDANGKVKSASIPAVLNVMSANPQAANIAENTTQKASIMLFPNPNNASFTLRLPEETSFGTITISDVTGKIVYRGETRERKTILHLQLEQGVYYLLFNDNKHLQTLQFIVQ
jgi:hypothetical protein